MLRDEGWLLDIFLGALRVRDYVDGVTEDEFSVNPVLQDAVVRRLEIIGEASNRLSAEFKNEHPAIPWKLIIGMRNRLVHEYFNVDLPRVWDVAVREIPELIQRLEPLIPPET